MSMIDLELTAQSIMGLHGRDLDAAIAQEVLGWREALVPPDAHGQNACVILTENGELPQGFDLPPLGFLHRAYMAPCWHSDLAAAIGLASQLGFETIRIVRTVNLAETIARDILAAKRRGLMPARVKLNGR